MKLDSRSTFGSGVFILLAVAGVGGYRGPSLPVQLPFSLDRPATAVRINAYTRLAHYVGFVTEQNLDSLASKRLGDFAAEIRTPEVVTQIVASIQAELQDLHWQECEMDHLFMRVAVVQPGQPRDAVFYLDAQGRVRLSYRGPCGLGAEALTDRIMTALHKEIERAVGSEGPGRQADAVAGRPGDSDGAAIDAKLADTAVEEWYPYLRLEMPALEVAPSDLPAGDGFGSGPRPSGISLYFSERGPEFVSSLRGAVAEGGPCPDSVEPPTLSIHLLGKKRALLLFNGRGALRVDGDCILLKNSMEPIDLLFDRIREDLPVSPRSFR